MSNRDLQDGQKRVIRKRCRFDPDLPFEVTAYRADADTPCVILREGTDEHYLTDSQARELIERLQRALNILPTSK